MCFSGSSAAPLAAAPAAPSPTAVDQPVGQARKAEDKTNFGSSTPQTRVDRSATSGGIAAGGAGIQI